jgi:hypothetical protein
MFYAAWLMFVRATLKPQSKECSVAYSTNAVTRSPSSRASRIEESISISRVGAFSKNSQKRRVHSAVIFIFVVVMANILSRTTPTQGRLT